MEHSLFGPSAAQHSESDSLVRTTTPSSHQCVKVVVLMAGQRDWPGSPYSRHLPAALRAAGCGALQRQRSLRKGILRHAMPGAQAQAEPIECCCSHSLAVTGEQKAHHPTPTEDNILD
jgi:hypothetical protein